MQTSPGKCSEPSQTDAAAQALLQDTCKQAYDDGQNLNRPMQQQQHSEPNQADAAAPALVEDTCKQANNDGQQTQPVDAAAPAL